MSDASTSLPVAGWYPDPADPSSERWWGGLEWTHTTRPLPPTVSAADVPGGGVDPFAAEAKAEGSQLASYDPATDDLAAFGYSSSGPAAGRNLATGPTIPQVSPSWYAERDRRAMEPPPSNGFATAGLVLSLVGFTLLGLIFSMKGLRRANDFEGRGYLPVGRKRARWGLGIVVATWGLLAAAVVYVFTAWESIEHWMAQTLQTRVAQAYDREAFEAGLTDAFTEGAGFAPDSVACPDSVEIGMGDSITCRMAWEGVTHSIVIVFTDEFGGFDYFVDGVLVP